MKCPRCSVVVHVEFSTIQMGVYYVKGSPKLVYAGYGNCPACQLGLLAAREYDRREDVAKFSEENIVFPRIDQKATVLPPEVPKMIADDFKEAEAVLAASPKASAALSRRCLQQLLTERGVSTKHDLNKAIDDALASGLPSHIADDLDAIREVGNFSAHPQKSQHSGEILPVEVQEAEWTLEVLALLFDHYYVKPTKAAERRDSFNTKLAEAGRNPLKIPPKR